MIKAIILFIVLASVAALSYILNKKTPAPEGCEKLRENCEGCLIKSCINHPLNGGK